MPRLDVKCLEKVVDFRFIKVDGQIVWPIAGALLGASRSAGHLVVIAKCSDEVFRVRFVGCQSTVARKLLRAGYFNENVLQTGGEADDAVCLALAGDDCLCSIEVIRRGRHRAAATRQRNCQRYPDDGANHAKIHHVRLTPCRMPDNHATHPANYIGSSADVKNLVPSKKRFGRLNTEMNIAPLGACATWMLPPGRHTKSPAPTLPSESSSDPSSMKVCSSAVCSCNGTTAPGAILNKMVERPSSSWYRIFICIPSKSVRCQGIDDAATKVERSSAGLTGEGLFMASSPEIVADFDPVTKSELRETRRYDHRRRFPPKNPPLRSIDLVHRHLVRDAAQLNASERWRQPVGIKQGPGTGVRHHLFRRHDRA